MTIKTKFKVTEVIVGLILITVCVLSLVLIYQNSRLNKQLRNLKEITLVQNTQAIDTLRKENVQLIKDLTKINERLLDYKITLAKVRKLNEELIARTKTVYIPELKNNRTSREILSDLEQHRKYMFISDSLNN
jgi:hypothetical protein